MTTYLGIDGTMTEQILSNGPCYTSTINLACHCCGPAVCALNMNSLDLASNISLTVFAWSLLCIWMFRSVESAMHACLTAMPLFALSKARLYSFILSNLPSHRIPQFFSFIPSSLWLSQLFFYFLLKFSPSPSVVIVCNTETEAKGLSLWITMTLIWTPLVRAL